MRHLIPSLVLLAGSCGMNSAYAQEPIIVPPEHQLAFTYSNDDGFLSEPWDTLEWCSVSVSTVDCVDTEFLELTPVPSPLGEEFTIQLRRCQGGNCSAEFRTFGPIVRTIPGDLDYDCRVMGSDFIQFSTLFGHQCP